jgi:adenylate cyclase
MSGVGGAHVTRKLTAILAADVVGFSRMMGVDEEATLERLKAHRKHLIDPKIAEHQGRIVKTTGDGLLVEFSSVVDAVRCAVEIQRAMGERNADLPPDRRIDFRIGINLGDVIVDGDDIFGDGVNVAARLESLAEPGGICVSRTVRDHVQDKLSFAFEDLGDRQVKNIARPVRVMRVILDADILIRTIPAPSASATAARRRRWLGALAAVVVVAIAMPLAWHLTARPGSEAPLAGADRSSIAVLRFADFGSEPQAAALADGLTEDIVTELAPVVGLAVSRGAAAKYKDAAADSAEIGIPELGRELGVRFVLVGSVRRVGDAVRVTAQLVQVADGDHIWAERYDLRSDDALKAQDELTESISTQLVVQIRRKDLEIARRKPAAALDGYDDYLLGKDYLARDSFEGIAQARALVERAIAANGRYAPAIGGLAIVEFRDFHLHRGALQGDAVLDRVFDTAQRSLSIEPGVSDATDAIASVYLFRRRHAEAADLLRKTIAATADDADLRERLGDVLIFGGDAAEGIATLERMMRVNPYYRQGFFAALARGYLLLDRRDDAIVQAETCMARAPDYRPCFEIAAIAYAEKGVAEKAGAAIAQIRRLDPIFTLAAAPAVLPFKNRSDLDRFIDGLRKAGLEK